MVLYWGNQQSFQYPEHLRNTKTAAKGSRIANHTWSNSHAIDFDNASIIDKGSLRTRKTLEAWHTKVTPDADNNSCPLPGQYNIPFSKCSLNFNYVQSTVSISGYLLVFREHFGGSWTLDLHDLPNTGQAFYPLSYENSSRARSFN